VWSMWLPGKNYHLSTRRSAGGKTPVERGKEGEVWGEVVAHKAAPQPARK
jgi:hypothetical protein